MGTQDGRPGSYVTAATAAKERADQCRRRRAELHAGARVSEPDSAASANQHLARAVERAHSADRRLAYIVVMHQYNEARRRAGISPAEPAPVLPPRLEHQRVSTRPAAELIESIATSTAAVLDLWIAFAAEGCEVLYIDFDGCVDGASSKSERDRQVLTQSAGRPKFGRAEP
ncbi:hypothetical protein ACWEOW_06850 [Monashia sp. NPDC004114]